ncbi:hydroxylamine reductase [Striga asiatica]|uniref:Hydroxylamine reductase n=1 Tax=Striga asiatica TaxID=4170 RepID=A0A5A7QEQ1_STRAF|nr:hydroxylamine reductase [Striga asiatica]
MLRRRQFPRLHRCTAGPGSTAAYLTDQTLTLQLCDSWYLTATPTMTPRPTGITAGQSTCRWTRPVMIGPNRHLIRPLILMSSGIDPPAASWARASPLYGATGIESPPHVDPPRDLVGRRDGREVGHLLAPVVSVRVEGVVVDAGVAIGVAGRHSYLDGGRDGVGGGREVEAEDGGVLEGENGLRGAYDCEDKDTDEDSGNDKGKEAREEATAVELLVGADFFRHVGSFLLFWGGFGVESNETYIEGFWVGNELRMF